MHVAILAGGSGTRFWPASRARRPKQVLSIVGRTPLLKAAYERARASARGGAVFVVTQERQAEAVRECLHELPPTHLVIEPEGRDTAAAITLASAVALGYEPDPVIAILPADHVIEPASAFGSTLLAAAARAQSSSNLITLGVRPTHPSTGFGYIRRGERVKEISGVAVSRVIEFREKPDFASATRMLQSGEYDWNAGIFTFRVSSLRAALERWLPEHARALGALSSALASGDREAVARVYSTLPRISIDFGVMEHAARAGLVEVVGLPAIWDDVGSWAAIARHEPADDQGNIVKGLFAGIQSKSNIVMTGEDHLIAAIGVDDLIIIHTDDATLVCRKSDAEAVKRVVDQLKERGLERFL